MTFEVAADAYSQFMGRFSEPLAAKFVALAEATPGQRALDVGCGIGALTATLVERLGAGAVAAIDPSESFVQAARQRLPGVDVRRGAAEHLPFPDGGFDVALAQLVVHFMQDPVAGVREMIRVTRPGGVVGACVWDHAGHTGPLSIFWQAALELDPGAPDESGFAGAREGHLADLFAAAGAQSIESTTLVVRVEFASFDEWWRPYTLGVGPAGAYVAQLDSGHRDELRARCATLLPPGEPFEISGTAWTVLARA